MREILLNRGKIAIVDAIDYDILVIGPKWQAVNLRTKWYAVRSVGPRGYRAVQRMHRLILDAPTRTEVDHKNGDGLDNRRENLRLATSAENRRNTKFINGAIPYKWVYFNKRLRKYIAQIWSGRRIHLGVFVDAESAARAYDVAHLRLHGEFSQTNAVMGLLK